MLENDGLIVLNKPSGMPTAGDTLEQPGSAQHALMQHYRRMIWAVHQLDRDTSGVNLFVRRKALVQTWSDHLLAGRKTYLAVVEGRFDGGLVEAPIGWVARGERGVTAEGKASLTEFVVLDSTDRATLVEAVLHTGRTHQIRIHAAHAGHPIIGDSRYGSASELIDRQALHAWTIQCGDQRFEAPLPTDLTRLLESLGLQA